jgi:CRP/FNR family transcriptional regulator, nitrogen fixation regulation protein
MRAQARPAAFPLHMALLDSNDNEIELPMSRQDIADYLALTIETVARTMSLRTRLRLTPRHRATFV